MYIYINKFEVSLDIYYLLFHSIFIQTREGKGILFLFFLFYHSFYSFEIQSGLASWSGIPNWNWTGLKNKKKKKNPVWPGNPDKNPIVTRWLF